MELNSKATGLFGVDADPLNHGVIVSLLANTLVYFAVTLWRNPRPIERMQASVFSLWSGGPKGIFIPEGRSITIAELKHSVANYLGRERCDRAFNAYFQQRDEDPDNRDLGRRRGHRTCRTIACEWQLALHPHGW